MPGALISLGSNIDPQDHIQAGARALRERFGESLRMSRLYWADAVGFDGATFINAAALLQTELGPAELSERLGEIEHEQGRIRSGERFSDRTLDIDLLTWGDAHGRIEGVELPRPELHQFGYVLVPVCDLTPAGLHPTLRIPYRELLLKLPKSEQTLRPLTSG